MMPVSLKNMMGKNVLGSLKTPLVAVAVSVMLAACGPLIDLPNSGPAPALYNLTPASGMTVEGTDARVLIEDPTATNGLDTTLIARRPAPTELQYFAGARWTARPTDMLQNLLSESLENAGQETTRARGGSPLPVGYELQVDVRDFQANYFNSVTVPEIQVRLAVTLVKLGPPRVIGSRTINVRRAATSGTMDAVVAAFDEATRDALGQTATWTVETIKSAP